MAHQISQGASSVCVAVDFARCIDRPQPLKQTNNYSTADIQERLRGGRVQAKPPAQDPADSQGLVGGAPGGRASIAERFKRRNG